jgi:hypothetical protein
MQQSFKCLFIGLTASIIHFCFFETQNVYAQTQFRDSDCYEIRSLNKNFATDKRYFRYLGARSLMRQNQESGTLSAYGSIPALEAKSQHVRFWKVTNTSKGFLLTTRASGSNGSALLNLDASSDGKTLALNRIGNITHGQYWQLEPDQGAYRIRSLNNNFRSQNYRWLDGKSNGSTVSIVNGKSHGTLWEIKSMGVCPSWFTGSAFR